MSENKTLALDLGSNSIGAIIRDPFEEDQIKKATVITFETGVGKDGKTGQYTISLSGNRTSRRSIRRLYQARKYKLWSILESLTSDKNNLYCPIQEESLSQWKHYSKSNGGRKYPANDIPFNNWIKLDFNNDGVPDYISPYQLRDELATVKLDFSQDSNRLKLGRALYHIAQKRGFKSSKIIRNKEDKKENKESEETTESAVANAIGAEKKKQDRFYTEVEKLGFSQEGTIGSIMARIEKDGIHNPEKKIEGIRIRKDLHQYVTRKLLIKEVKHIFEFQGLEFGKIFKDKSGNPAKYENSDVFRQRPLRSQKGLIGVCTLENRVIKVKDSKNNLHFKLVGKKRCPISRPEFEEFRALSLLNNIEYRIKGEKGGKWESLVENHKGLRDELFKEKFFRVSKPTFDFVEIYNWLKQKNGHDRWELNYNLKTNVSGCPVSARLQKILGSKWNGQTKQKDKNGKSVKNFFFTDLWHVLFESNDEDFVSEYAIKHGLNEKELTNLWFALPTGYSQLSLKAINNILPFLREGMIYTYAVLLAKVPEILGDDLWEQNKEEIINSIKNKVIEKNRSDRKILNIVNDLISQYKASGTKERKGYVVGSLDNKLPQGSKERDSVKIATTIQEGFGKAHWDELPREEKAKITADITSYYQKFFNSTSQDFYHLPRLGDAMKDFLVSKFPEQFQCESAADKVEKEKCCCKNCNQLNKLYHPSLISIYPKAKREYYKYRDIEKQTVLLGSPQIGSLKNPMAMRTLQELKKLINFYIASDEIDEDTRVVVEVGRELVDTNKRWAYETHKRIREEENKQFAEAIRELVKKDTINANPDSASDIDKFRLWYEMIESSEGYEEKRTKEFISIDEDRIYGDRKTQPRNKRKKGKERGEEQQTDETYYSFNENHFDRIKKEVWVKLQKAKNNIEERYRLWKEQEYICIYTGKPIKITDLFNPNLIDVEHTVPRSISFDNSLANKTICYADYNRNTKKNKIPSQLPSLDYEAVMQRIEKWEQKVKDLEARVEFWKGKSKQASTKDYKDTCIREKHLWQFELDYWRNKIGRFRMQEVKPSFKNSQLKDTQIISKYAFHYLKSYFNFVEVQKGTVTAEFRKILNIQDTNTQKDRSKHSHHAKDAIILSIIPSAAIRDKILEVWYKIKEQKQLLASSTSEERRYISEKIEQLTKELTELKNQCNFPKGVNSIINKIDETLIINNIARNRSLLPAKKKINVRGKIRTATGDAVRGQLHLDTFYGKIQMVERDENGKPLRNNDGKWKFIEGDKGFKFVLRKEVDKSLNINKIVDPKLKKIIQNQIGKRTLSQTLSEDGGLFMLDKDGNRTNKIRHIRCFSDDVTDPISVKEHILVGKKEHKNYYWSKNGENIICAFYQSLNNGKKGKKEQRRSLEIISLKDAADLLKAGIISKVEDIESNLYRKDKNGHVIIDDQGKKEQPYALLRPGMKVIFYDDSISELAKQNNEKEESYKKRLSYRTYRIVKYSGGQITFQHHMEARGDTDLKNAYPDYKQDDNGNYIDKKGNIIERSNKKDRISLYGVAGTSGFTKKISDALIDNEANNFEPWPRLRYTADWLNMAIEDKHFEITPDGEIRWLIGD